MKRSPEILSPIFIHLAGIHYLACFICLLAISCDQKNAHTALNNEAIVYDTTYYNTGSVEQILRLKDQLLNRYSLSFYPSGVLKTKKHFINDTAIGNFFRYYPNGNLMKFCYLADDTHSVYERTYDSLGNLTHEMGTPFVGYRISSKTAQDTLHMELIVCDVGYKSMNLAVSPNGVDYKDMDLFSGEIEGTRVAKIRKHVHGLDHISVYLKMDCFDSANNHRLYVDTLSLRK